MLGEAKSPLLDEFQVSKPSQRENPKERGAPLRVWVRIDELDE
jgi:hypothetical protein